MKFSFRKILLGLLLTIFLLPAIAFANTEFKGKETVNINRANAATLAAYLHGVGANKAEAIVKFRKANGKFKSIEDLKNVPGIGDETFKDVKKNVSTSRGKSVAPEGYKMAETSGKSKSTKKKKSSTSSTNKKTTAKKSTSKKKSTTKKASDDSDSSTKKSTKSSNKKSTAKKTAASKKSATTKKKTTKAKKSSTTKSTKKKTTKKKPAKKKTTKKKTTKKKGS